MKIIPHRPDLGQKYSNPFKDKRVYPFNKIGRVVVEKTTGDILLWLGENDSKLTLDGAPWTYNENLHDIMVHFPAFYYKRNWNGDILEDSILTDLPKDVVSDKVGYEIFPVFVREDGTIRPYVLYGAFKGVELGGQLRSVVGYKPTVNKTISAFRDLARQGRDSRWNIETFGIISMVQFLYKIAFQDLDSQKILGNGWTSKTASAITGSTMGLGNRCGFLDPFENSPDKPHESISMSFQCVDGELVFYNKKDSDPMPIKTTNMAGLQKWEETEDYTIYLCKDATMTVVENYVTGTFQEFQERKAQIEANQELMKSYLIEWTEQDSIDLINDINNKALMSLALKPTTLDLEETPNEIQVLSARAVPVTYECCFRMDKKSGEFYIGEGYENFVNPSFLTCVISDYTVSYDSTTDTYTATKRLPENQYSLLRPKLGADDGKGAYACIELISNSGAKANWYVAGLLGALQIGKNKRVFTNTQTLSGANKYLGIGGGEVGEQIIEFKNFMVLNIESEKPFVKSVMPSGKLAFVTNATSEMHSFVLKGIDATGKGLYISFLGQGEGVYWRTAISSDGKPKTITNCNVVMSSLFSRAYAEQGEYTMFISQEKTPTGTLNCIRHQYAENYSFKQLLIYKANLSETELKAENSKVIKATDNQNTSLEYPANGNQISLFGIEDFFGNIWSFADGFFVKDDGYYITNEPNKMGILSEHIHYPATPLMGVNDGQNVEGYFKTIEKSVSVYNIPNLLGSSATKNYTDNLVSHKRGQSNLCLFGGRIDSSYATGVFFMASPHVTSIVNPTFGARLTFLP